VNTLQGCVLVVALFATAGVANASDSVPAASLRPVADREVCANEKLALDGAKTRLALCVKSAMFQHDQYTLKIDGRAVAAGIDDETTQGVTGQSGDRPVRLVCEPVIEKHGEPTPGLVEAFVKKGMSEDQARKTAELTTMVEAARNCAISVNDSVRWNVRVQF
jgi:hypothetical protein